MGTEQKIKDLWQGYFDCIDAAYDKGLLPAKLLKLIDAVKKTDSDLKILTLAALNKFSRKKKYYSSNAAIEAFIKSKEFKKIIPAGIAKKKKFFEKSGMYMTRDSRGMVKTLRKNLTFSEHKRYKFVENIYSEFKKTIKKKPSSAAGIASLLLPKSH